MGIRCIYWCNNILKIFTRSFRKYRLKFVNCNAPLIRLCRGIYGRLWVELSNNSGHVWNSLKYPELLTGFEKLSKLDVSLSGQRMDSSGSNFAFISCGFISCRMCAFFVANMCFGSEFCMCRLKIYVLYIWDPLF